MSNTLLSFPSLPLLPRHKPSPCTLDAPSPPRGTPVRMVVDVLAIDVLRLTDERGAVLAARIALF